MSRLGWLLLVVLAAGLGAPAAVLAQSTPAPGATPVVRTDVTYPRSIISTGVQRAQAYRFHVVSTITVEAADSGENRSVERTAEGQLRDKNLQIQSTETRGFLTSRLDLIALDGEVYSRKPSQEWEVEPDDSPFPVDDLASGLRFQTAV